MPGSTQSSKKTPPKRRVEKDTNAAEPTCQDAQNIAVPSVRDAENRAEPACWDAENEAEPTCRDAENEVEPTCRDPKNMAEPTCRDVRNAAEPSRLDAQISRKITRGALAGDAHARSAKIMGQIGRNNAEIMRRARTGDAFAKSAEIIGQINPEPGQRMYTAKQWKHSENQSAQKSSGDNQRKAQNQRNTIMVDGYNAPIGENGAQVVPENIAEPPELKNFQ
ncbi:hypothetical protein DFH08DRAFT_818488 [Mycena albidolilacea]|uniref:Uncharacterized protein n=1 Tax=Mycena albidolilacea TaxID=1033008 RepID=A0AAD6ZG52_9AGAR|nr:hypothetical protein DFH08DRAFT_818488 [Mycena albidolilacea]